MDKIEASKNEPTEPYFRLGEAHKKMLDELFSDDEFPMSMEQFATRLGEEWPRKDGPIKFY